MSNSIAPGTSPRVAVSSMLRAQTANVTALNKDGSAQRAIIEQLQANSRTSSSNNVTETESSISFLHGEGTNLPRGSLIDVLV